MKQSPTKKKQKNAGQKSKYEVHKSKMSFRTCENAKKYSTFFVLRGNTVNAIIFLCLFDIRSFSLFIAHFSMRVARAVA